MMYYYITSNYQHATIRKMSMSNKTSVQQLIESLILYYMGQDFP